VIKDIKSEGDVIIITSDKGQTFIRLQVEIANFLKFNDSIIVRTVAISKERARNIHHYREDGTKIWTIEEPEGAEDQANAFTGLWLDQSGKLMGGTWQGMEYEIDFETGKLLKSRFTK